MIIKSSVGSCAPHLRNPSAASLQRTLGSASQGLGSVHPAAEPSVSILESEASASDVIIKLSAPMNAGLKEKSAAKDSTFPCSYQNCSKGFSRAKDLIRHKTAVHEWCSVCDLDCEDDVALHEHRIASTLAGEGKHIACLKCGEDFNCEAGRQRHTQLVSPASTQLPRHPLMIPISRSIAKCKRFNALVAVQLSRGQRPCWLT